MSEFNLPPSAETSKSTNKGKTSVKDLTDKKDVKADPAKDEKEAVKPLYSEEELLKIFDEIIFAGVYTENINVRNKLKITLKTRTAEEIEDITQQLDSTTANLISTLNEKRSLLNLHYALVSYQGQDLSFMPTDKKQAFINKLPAVIVGVMINCLQKFDSKVFTACKEGEENF